MEKARQLGSLRDEIERDISDLLQQLGGVGEHGSLLDPEGYPRADIDVHGIRSVRNQLAKKRTDLKNTNTQLEDALHAAHAETQAGAAGAASDEAEVVDTVDTSQSKHKPERLPFASVDEVTPGSPAAEAGIECGDLLLLFGSVDKSNFSGMESVATIVRSSVGKRIRVMLKRNDKLKLLPLFPKKWAGQGVLGCRIVPLK